MHSLNSNLRVLKGRGHYDITVLHCVIRIRGSPLRTTICSQRFHGSDPSRILKLLFRYRAGIQNVKRRESQNLHSFFWFLKVPQCFGRKLRFPTLHWSLATDTNWTYENCQGNLPQRNTTGPFSLSNFPRPQTALRVDSHCRWIRIRKSSQNGGNESSFEFKINYPIHHSKRLLISLELRHDAQYQMGTFLLEPNSVIQRTSSVRDQSL